MLLAYSGGPDSKALLYLMLELKKTIPLDIHLAHVDHGWREKSANEALELKEEAEKLGLPFYLKTLKHDVSSNLEDTCRLLRYQFFKDLYVRHGFDALLLAHQLDDLQETIMKRFFEGAALFNLKGMDERSVLFDMRILRPLLFIPKNELALYLKESRLSYFEDDTNLSPRFLRGRMRSRLIPKLQTIFGKNITPALIRVKKQAEALKDYLDFKIAQPFESRVKSAFGCYLDFLPYQLQPFEIKYLIKKIGDEEKIELSYNVIERLSEAVVKGKNLSLDLHEHSAYVDRKRLFFIKSNYKIEETFLIERGAKFWIGPWLVKCTGDDAFLGTSWKDLFKEGVRALLPAGKYRLALPRPGSIYENKSFKKVLAEVPSFLRFSFPVIYKEEEIFAQFLAKEKKARDAKDCLLVEIKYCSQSHE